MADQVNALIPLQVQPFNAATAFTSGVNATNALLNAPVERSLKQAQAKYYSEQAGNSVYGTPIFGTDANGNTVLGAIGKDGTFRRLDTGSVTPTPGVKFEDLGTSVQGFNTKSGAPVGSPLPKAGSPSTNFIPGQDGQPGSYQPGSEEAYNASLPKKGQNDVDSLLNDLGDYYGELDQLGASVDPNQSALHNIGAKFQSSDLGQAVGGALGTKTQTVIDNINTVRPALINAIRNATHMSARAMDSNVELQFYLQQATNPSLGRQANIAAMNRIRELYGAGSNNAAPGQGAAATQAAPPSNVNTQETANIAALRNDPRIQKAQQALQLMRSRGVPEDQAEAEITQALKASGFTDQQIQMMSQ